MRLLSLITLLVSQLSYSQTTSPLEIIIDADYSNHTESSISIQRGLEMALKTVNSKINDRDIIVKTMDHRGNSKRSKLNVKKFIKSPNGLFMMSGIHSPPLLANKNYINENKVPFLIPWAAAGPITRSEGKENWIYRLSIDDSKAGLFLSDYASSKGFKSPCLLLEDTGWGKSNVKTMTKGFKKNNIDIQKISWFKWGIKEASSNKIARELYASGCDVVLLVANSKEGASLIKAIYKNKGKKILPIISHWGITGGDFHNVINHKIRDAVQLKFIQTKFNFISSNLNKNAQYVLNKAIKEYSDVKGPQDIKASTGFIHAYDIGLIAIEALKTVDFNQDIKKVRLDFKLALEKVDKTVNGLLKNYNRPFSKYAKDKANAHEALSIEDYAIGYYGKDNEIMNEK